MQTPLWSRDGGGNKHSQSSSSGRRIFLQDLFLTVTMDWEIHARFQGQEMEAYRTECIVCGHRTWGKIHNCNTLSTEGVWIVFNRPGLESGGGDSCPSTETHLKWKHYRIPVGQTRDQSPGSNWLYDLGWVTSLLLVSVSSSEKCSHNIHSKELLRGGWYHAYRKPGHSTVRAPPTWIPFTIPAVVSLWE